MRMDESRNAARKVLQEEFDVKNELKLDELADDETLAAHAYLYQQSVIYAEDGMAGYEEAAQARDSHLEVVKARKERLERSNQRRCSA